MVVLCTDRIGIRNVGFVERGKLDKAEKAPEQDEKQRQTQPIYDTGPLTTAPSLLPCF